MILARSRRGLLQSTRRSCVALFFSFLPRPVPINLALGTLHHAALFALDLCYCSRASYEALALGNPRTHALAIYSVHFRLPASRHEVIGLMAFAPYGRTYAHNR